MLNNISYKNAYYFHESEETTMVKKILHLKIFFN
jgi:hypothetical protein